MATEDLSAKSIVAEPKRAVERAHLHGRRAASNPWLELLERVGYVVRGVLYSVMGLFAFGLALGVAGQAVDQSGSLVMIASNPAGGIVLICVAVGLGAYSLWGFVRAIYDPLHRGDDASGVAQRLGFVWSGIAYGAMAFFALGLLAGRHQSAAHDGTQATIARVLAYPAGHWIAMVIGVIAIGVGLGQFVDAYRAVFKHDLKRHEMSAEEKKIVDTLGRWGMVSRGVTFTLVGWFVLQGGLHRDASLVHGFGGAFYALLTAPFGRVVLAVVALGFVALGIHSFACAKWMRLLGSRS